MFEKRLAWFSLLLGLLAVVIIGRLVQIQVVEAAQYEDLAAELLTRPVRYLPAPRGSILDRNGTPVLSDVPTYDIAIHFGALTRNPDYLKQAAWRMRERGDFPRDMPTRDIANFLPSQIVEMWWRLAELTGLSREELDARAQTVVDRVERWREASGQDMIREEKELLPVVENVSNDMALAVRLELERYPWLRVVPSSERVAHDADSLCHLLGRLGAASPSRIASDPLKDDELRALRRTDQVGVSGVERLAETTLRGWRGRIVEARDWTELEHIDPVPGRDVRLTIDLPLQKKVVELLAAGVHNADKSLQAGAAAVVVDVDSREILALASYPTYDYDGFSENYARMRADRRYMPLLFRAVQARYPPGSICKAISLIGGLTEGVVTPETTFTCNGHLLPNKPDRFKCWIQTQYGGRHGPQRAVEGVRNSCNIYFFKVGGLLGPERLCQWFQRFGLGQTTGTGLIEESPGLNPTEEWLSDPARANPRHYREADAWNFAIGQGEVLVTPVQAANVAATAASGRWEPLRLVYDQRGRLLGEETAPPRTFDERHMRVLRQGMWEVVNHPRGTARRVKLDAPGYVMCGKTGSAQTPCRVLNTRYTLEFPDGRRETVIALTRRDALAQFPDEEPTVVSQRPNALFPRLAAGARLPSHAWFIGYTQTEETPPGAPPRGKVYAIAVIVEFAGSGGRQAGPVAKAIAEHLVGDDAQ